MWSQNEGEIIKNQPIKGKWSENMTWKRIKWNKQKNKIEIEFLVLLFKIPNWYLLNFKFRFESIWLWDLPQKVPRGSLSLGHDDDPPCDTWHRSLHPDGRRSTISRYYTASAFHRMGEEGDSTSPGRHVLILR